MFSDVKYWSILSAPFYKTSSLNINQYKSIKNISRFPILTKYLTAHIFQTKNTNWKKKLDV